MVSKVPGGSVELTVVEVTSVEIVVVSSVVNSVVVLLEAVVTTPPLIPKNEPRHEKNGLLHMRNS